MQLLISDHCGTCVNLMCSNSWPSVCTVLYCTVLGCTLPLCGALGINTLLHLPPQTSELKGVCCHHQILPPLCKLWLLEYCCHDIGPIAVAHHDRLPATVYLGGSGDAVSDALQPTILHKECSTLDVNGSACHLPGCLKQLNRLIASPKCSAPSPEGLSMMPVQESSKGQHLVLSYGRRIHSSQHGH
jgi:hypothetical protein